MCKRQCDDVATDANMLMPKSPTDNLSLKAFLGFVKLSGMWESC